MNIVCKYLVPNGFKAITIFPFVFYKNEIGITDKTDNHEKIHLMQQLEMLVLPFFIWYGIEFIIRKMTVKNAYRSISFEREAYSNQSNKSYLKDRKFYNWTKYL